MFMVTDSYGTRQTCWSWAEALRWLAACSPVAQVRNRFTGRVIAAREVRS